MNSNKARLRDLYRFTAARRFVAGRDELLEAGFAASTIDNWIRNGRLVRILNAVYSYGRDVDSRSAALHAALIATGEGSALRGRTACEEWGMVKPVEGIPREIQVAAATGQARMIRGVSPALRNLRVKVVRRDFERGDIRHPTGLDVVNPSLALIDFAADASEREARFAFLEACRLDLFRKRDVDSCFQRMTGCRGAKKLRPYLALWVPELKRIRSVLEGWFLLVWVKHKLPMPKVNEKVFGYEVDFHWPAQRLILELDGAAFHRGPIQQKLDAEKQEFLEARGYTVLRAGYKEFAADPDQFIALVARAHFENELISE